MKFKIPIFSKRNAELTVEKIIEVAEELEETRISGQSLNVLDQKLSNTTQFQATKRWNKLISKFYERMPRKKHRGFILCYPDSFYGKNALDFLMNDLLPKIVPNKPITETNAIKFMELLLKKHLMENVKLPDSQMFNEKAIYRFLTINMAAEIESTTLKRSNSLTSLKSPSRFASSFKSTNLMNRKLSSSHSNLDTLIKASTKIQSINATQRQFIRSRMLQPTVEFDEEQETFYCKKEPTKVENYPQTSSSSSSAESTTTISSTASSSSSSSSKNIRPQKRQSDSKITNVPIKKAYPASPSLVRNQPHVTQTSRDLLILLDAIIADETLTPEQKQKKLDSFRRTYPRLYSSKFPATATVQPKPKRQPTPTRIVNKVRNLTRRNSEKK